MFLLASKGNKVRHERYCLASASNWGGQFNERSELDTQCRGVTWHMQYKRWYVPEKPRNAGRGRMASITTDTAGGLNNTE